MGSAGDVAATGGVDVQHGFERLDAPVVGVGRGDLHIAQTGRAEHAHVFGQATQLEHTPVVLRERPGTTDVVEPGVAEGLFQHPGTGMHHLVVEIEAAMAMKALGFFAKKQIHATLFGGCQGHFACGELVVLAVATDQRALKTRNRLDNIAPVDGAALPGKSRCKFLLVKGQIGQTLQHLRLVAVVQAHLDRAFTKQRHLHLLFQSQQ